MFSNYGYLSKYEESGRVGSIGFLNVLHDGGPTSHVLGSSP